MQVSDDASASVVYGLLQEAKDGMRSNSVTGVQDFFTHEVCLLPLTSVADIVQVPNTWKNLNFSMCGSLATQAAMQFCTGMTQPWEWHLQVMNWRQAEEAERSRPGSTRTRQPAGV